jgi:hypothetical protein
MSTSIESPSQHEKTTFLARLADTFTVCARDTYELGSDQVLTPEVLRTLQWHGNSARGIMGPA